MIDSNVATAGLQNFWFDGKTYKITKAGIYNNAAYVTVEPENPELVAKITKQLLQHENIIFSSSRGFTHFADEAVTFEAWADKKN